PPFSTFFFARARYLPLLSASASLYLPRPVVRSVPTVFQTPFFLRWIFTVTWERQALNPSATLTTPVATSEPFSFRETDRVCFTTGAATVNVPPVAVPTALVTVIGPVVAPTGTVVVICVLELTVKVAVVPLNFTD